MSESTEVFSVGLVLCFLRYLIWQGKYILYIVYDAMFSRISEISGGKKGKKLDSKFLQG